MVCSFVINMNINKNREPMQKKTTTVKLEISANAPSRPKMMTVNLIKQFARAYACDRTLQPGLRNFILN